MARLRIHLVMLPYVKTCKRFFWDAFLTKGIKFSTMMQSIPDVEVVLYSPEENEADCAEHVPVISAVQYDKWFGDWPWETRPFDRFDSSEEWWMEFNRNTIRELAQRVEPGDIVCLSMGLAHKPIYDALASWSEAYFVEHAIGYPGVFAPFRIYESHAWRHHIAGVFVGRGNKNWLGDFEDDTVRHYDCVIGNYFETDAFPYGEGGGNYYAFIGRLTERKGLRIAALACERIGATLVVAGQGDFAALELPGDVTYVGLVDEDQRCALMQGAIAQFAPSTYLEPFCAASVEPQLCGTPVIGTRWGALLENVDHGVSGYLCDTLKEFAEAAEAAADLDRPTIRERAQARWSTEVLKWEHLEYFERVAALRTTPGWYA